MGTTKTGNVSLGEIGFALVSAGVPVLVPLTEGYPYDLAIELNGKLLRVQCRTAKALDGALSFSTRYPSSFGPSRSMSSDVDYFAVYSRELKQVFMVPASELPGTLVTLRLDPPRNNQGRVRWADEFRIEALVS
jgi:hypothetical protein